MSYKLHLLVAVDFEGLGRMEQSLALDLARHAGMRSVLGESAPSAPGMRDCEVYYAAVVRPAASRGMLSRREEEAWLRRCQESGPADPRVGVFMAAWRERAAVLRERVPEPRRPADAIAEAGGL